MKMGTMLDINFHDLARDPLIAFFLLIPMTLLSGYLFGVIIIMLEYMCSDHLDRKDVLELLKGLITFWKK